MRLLAIIFSSLTMICLLCAPALAQSSPSAAQYQGGGSGYCPPNTLCVQSLGDGADDLSENAGQGTDAVNEALEEPEASTASASTVPAVASASPAGGTSSSETDGDGDDQGGSGGAADAGTGKGLDAVTELPETGGASLAALGSGLLLATFGLVALRLAGR